jgi:uncharacterized protein HemY
MGSASARRAIVGIVIAVIVIICLLFLLIAWTVCGFCGTGRFFEKAKRRKAERLAAQDAQRDAELGEVTHLPALDIQGGKGDQVPPEYKP